MRCIVGLVALLAVSGWTEAEVVLKTNSDEGGEDEGEMRVAQQLEEANNNLNHDNKDSVEMNGNIAASCQPTLTNACVLHGFTWPKASDGKVYIPYVIANHYSSQELEIIKRGIISFSYSTCIRFFPRTNQQDYLSIQSLDGCHSCVGRQGNAQIVSLCRRGCIHFGTVQHELLHALGFDHEHCRSDRDQHIRVLKENVLKGHDYNFNKVDSLNQETPYDYGSVMHYSRLAFSKDNYSPTMVAVPGSNVVFGVARKMSQKDIERINLLYCKN